MYEVFTLSFLYLGKPKVEVFCVYLYSEEYCLMILYPECKEIMFVFHSKPFSKSKLFRKLVLVSIVKWVRVHFYVCIMNRYSNVLCLLLLCPVMFGAMWC